MTADYHDLIRRSRELLEGVDVLIATDPLGALDSDNARVMNAQVNLAAQMAYVADRAADIALTEARIKELTVTPTQDSVES